MAEVDGARILKKYPNRRLYDTEESRYITLNDVRQLVLERVDFVVIDKASGEDISRQILLQVIAEQEAHGDPALSREFLSQLIRGYGGQLHDVVGTYLEQSMRLLEEQREKVREKLGPDPKATIRESAQRNYRAWMRMQDEIFEKLRNLGRKDD